MHQTINYQNEEPMMMSSLNEMRQLAGDFQSIPSQTRNQNNMRQGEMMRT